MLVDFENDAVLRQFAESGRFHREVVGSGRQQRQGVVAGRLGQRLARRSGSCVGGDYFRSDDAGARGVADFADELSGGLRHRDTRRKRTNRDAEYDPFQS